MSDELILLGQVFLDNNVFYKINLLPDDFEDPRCRSLYKTMAHLVDKGLEIDEVAVHKTNGRLEVGWLSQVRDSAHSPANYEFYEKRIKNVSNLRRLKSLSIMITDNLEQGKTAEEIKEAVETELTALVQSTDGWSTKTITAVMMAAVEQVEERYRLHGTLPGINTGFEHLNRLTLGFRPRLLYIFAARPSRGKTALMLNMAIAASVTHKVGIINTESANQEMGVRILSSHTGIPSERLASGQIQNSDFGRMTHSAGLLSERTVMFYDEPNATLSTVIAKCREMKRKDGCEVIFVDYLQNITYSEKNTERENLGHISSRLKQISRILNIPIVCLAQLRRDSEGSRPGMSDLLGSGKIEQDADLIGLLWWKHLNKGVDEPPEYEHWLICDKNRDGQTGDIPLHFDNKTVKFTEIVK